MHLYIRENNNNKNREIRELIPNLPLICLISFSGIDPNDTDSVQMRFFVGMPAIQLLLATRKGGFRLLIINYS